MSGVVNFVQNQLMFSVSRLFQLFCRLNNTVIITPAAVIEKYWKKDVDPGKLSQLFSGFCGLCFRGHNNRQSHRLHLA
jgi:hypothetical protein